MTDLAGWQPIESAPRDGTRILIFGRPTDLEIDDVIVLSFKRAISCTASWDEIDQLFCLTGGSYLGPFMDAPTHWMPLPDPPEAGK